jgi:ribosome-associated translation inhibitor RaiA
MYLLVTLDKDKLHGFYSDFIDGPLAYFGYTDSYRVAEVYASQFKIPGGTVFYVDVTDEFAKYIVAKMKLTEISVWKSEDDSVTIALSDNETEYCDEVLSDECGSEFDDLLYAIDNLDRFLDKRVRKLRRELKKLYKVLNDPDDDDELDRSQDLINNMDMAKHYKFIASRLGLFNYNCGNWDS